MGHNLGSDYVFYDFACDAGQGDWAVVGWDVSLSFLEDRGYYGCSPV